MTEDEFATYDAYPTMRGCLTPLAIGAFLILMAILVFIVYYLHKNQINFL